MNVHLFLMIFVSAMYLFKIWRNRLKPFTWFEFYWQLTGAILLISMSFLDNAGGMGFRILLTVLGIIGFVQCIWAFSKHRKTAGSNTIK